MTFAQNQPSGGLSALGVSPVGGVISEGGLAASPIQVALNAPATPVTSSLVSLITLTQVISLNHDGGGIQWINCDEPTVAEASDVAATIDQTEDSEQPEPLRMLAQPGPMANDGVPLGQDNRPNVVDRVKPASTIVAEAAASPGPDFVARDETKTAGWNGALRLVITGAIVTAAFRWRPAIRDLKWRKRARAEPSRSTGPISRHRSHGDTTITWRPDGKNGARPDGLERAVQPAGLSRSRDAR